MDATAALEERVARDDDALDDPALSLYGNHEVGALSIKVRDLSEV